MVGISMKVGLLTFYKLWYRKNFDFTDFWLPSWWCNTDRSGRIPCHTMNKGKNTIEKIFVIAIHSNIIF